MKMKKLFKELVKVIIGRSKTINVSKTLRKTNYNIVVLIVGQAIEKDCMHYILSR